MPTRATLFSALRLTKLLFRSARRSFTSSDLYGSDETLRLLMGPDVTWFNLGLWPAASHPVACRQLHERTLAMLTRTQDIGAAVDCGACGDGLALTRAVLRPASLVGVNLAARGEVMARDAVGYLEGLPAGSLDLVISVDAAYHFQPSRGAFLAAAHRALRPGGQVALADVQGSGRGRRWISGLCRAAGVPSENLRPGAVRADLAAAGFEIDAFEDVTEQVFRPFARSCEGRGSDVLEACAILADCIADRDLLRFVLAAATRPL